MEKVKEFLMRKGPAGVPYWGLGLAGLGVIGGTIWLQRSGVLSGLAATAPGAPGDTTGGGGGSGAGGIPPDTAPPPAVPPGPPDAPPPPSTPPLIGQQDGTTSGGLSNPPPPPPPSGPPPVGTVLTQPGTNSAYLIQGFNGGILRPAVTPPGYVPPASGTIAQRRFGTSAAAPTPGGETSGAGPVGQDVIFANPVPATQTQVVQYRAPSPTPGRRGGPQAQ